MWYVLTFIAGLLVGAFLMALVSINHAIEVDDEYYK